MDVMNLAALAKKKGDINTLFTIIELLSEKKATAPKAVSKVKKGPVVKRRTQTSKKVTEMARSLVKHYGSQKQVSRKTGIHQATISIIMRGLVKKPTPATVVKFENALKGIEE